MDNEEEMETPITHPVVTIKRGKDPEVQEVDIACRLQNGKLTLFILVVSFEFLPVCIKMIIFPKGLIAFKMFNIELLQIWARPSLQYMNGILVLCQGSLIVRKASFAPGDKRSFA